MPDTNPSFLHNVEPTMKYINFDMDYGIQILCSVHTEADPLNSHVKL